MNFKEVFNRYKEGKATAEEIHYIEEEIEKNELINEYIAGEIELSFQETEVEESGDSELTKQIHRAVSKKLRDTVIKSVAIVGLIFFMIHFVASPVMNRVYYNPLHTPGNEEVENQLQLDVAVYSNLHFPTRDINFFVTSEKLGYGGYNIEIRQTDSFLDKDYLSTGKLVRGKFVDLSREFYFDIAINEFKNGIDPHNVDYINFHDEELIKELKEMPSTAQGRMNISFKKDIDLETLLALEKKYENVSFDWAAIRYSNDPENIHIGFHLNGMPIGYELKGYPLLSFTGLKNPYTPEQYETHVQSSLTYMRDQEKFLEAMDTDKWVYQQALTYLKKNGVKVYGVVVTGNCQELLKLIEDDDVDGFLLKDVKLSKFGG